MYLLYNLEQKKRVEREVLVKEFSRPENVPPGSLAPRLSEPAGAAACLFSHRSPWLEPRRLTPYHSPWRPWQAALVSHRSPWLEPRRPSPFHSPWRPWQAVLAVGAEVRRFPPPPRRAPPKLSGRSPPPAYMGHRAAVGPRPDPGNARPTYGRRAGFKRRKIIHSK